MNPSSTLLWFFIAILASAASVPFLKQYSRSNNPLWIVLSVASVIMLLYAYIHLMKESDIEVLYAFVKILLILFVTVGGIVFFESKLDMHTIIGILFGILSVYMLSYNLVK